MNTERKVDAFLDLHWGVIARHEALALGVAPGQISWALRTGRWLPVYRGVYRPRHRPLGPEGAALAASRSVGAGGDAVISHRSAAWVWGMLQRPPARPALTVASGRHSRRAGMELHRSADLSPSRIRVVRNLRLTEPVRTLVDLAAVVDAGEVDLAVDRARAAGLVTIGRLEAETERLARRGRAGPRALRDALDRRGLVEPPTPSVLESRVARLLKQWGIPVLGVERTVLGGRYRLDFLLLPDVALEVDGYAFHSSPEAKAADATRRAALAAAGIVVIESDWVTVMRRPAALRRTITAVLDRHRARSVGGRR